MILTDPVFEGYIRLPEIEVVDIPPPKQNLGSNAAFTRYYWITWNGHCWDYEVWNNIVNYIT